MFIVIDGNDGAGKTTQAQLLVEKLKRDSKKVTYIDFPRYETEYGKMVASYLRNEYGPADQISPYLASLPYALDRKNAKDEIEEALKDDGYVIANRYVSSNMAYQGAKLKTPAEQKSFFTWISHLEYEYHGIPKEDMVIYLYVPRSISDRLIDTRAKKDYLHGQQKDAHEANTTYLDTVQTQYRILAKQYPHWYTIQCTDSTDTLQSVSAIHHKVIDCIDKHTSR